MQQILKASELPPGARLMGRQGQALTGIELASGVAALAEKLAGSPARLACEIACERSGWARMNLTFPKARLEWTPCTAGLWLRLELGPNRGAWEWEWASKDADVREMVSVGPFVSPDDFREALGLPRVAQFKLPNGQIVTAEMPGTRLRPYEPDREKLLSEIAATDRWLERREELDKVDLEKVAQDRKLAEQFGVGDGPAIEALPVMEAVRKEASEAIERMAERKAEIKAIEEVVVAAVVASKPEIKSDIKVGFEPVTNPLTGQPIEVSGGFVKQFSQPARTKEHVMLDLLAGQPSHNAPVELPMTELLAEPPRAEPALATSAPVAQAEPKFGKGSRGKREVKV